MKKMYPEKLKQNDVVRIIAPSKSLSENTAEEIQQATEKLESLGLKVTFGRNCYETDLLESSSIASRINDLHDAFKDDQVKAVICAKGGFNANQLLGYINWELIKNNPKIFTGYSDITALNAAIYAKTGLVTYSASTFSSYRHDDFYEYTVEYIRKALFQSEPYPIIGSNQFSDWSSPDENGNSGIFKSNGFWVINEGKADGTIIGENLCTVNLLQGTEYMPPLENSILFIEDDYESKAENFDRDLQSLMHQSGFSQVKAIIIGRFQSASEVTKEKLEFIIKTKQDLEKIPVIANVDFGHTLPRIAFPIGGIAIVDTTTKDAQIIIKEH